MENEQWDLIPTDDINQILKVRNSIADDIKSDFPELLIVKHQYTTSDDVLFPELSTLGYLNSFEQQSAMVLENKGKLLFAATDIAKGMINIYLYCKDARSTVIEAIETLKKMPLFKVEFEIKQDPTWSMYKSLHS